MQFKFPAAVFYLFQFLYIILSKIFVITYSLLNKTDSKTLTPVVKF